MQTLGLLGFSLLQKRYLHISAKIITRKVKGFTYFADLIVDIKWAYDDFPTNTSTCILTNCWYEFDNLAMREAFFHQFWTEMGKKYNEIHFEKYVIMEKVNGMHYAKWSRITQDQCNTKVKIVDAYHISFIIIFKHICIDY